MVTDKENAPMFYPHVISSFESEVASPQAAQIFRQKEDCLHSLWINPIQHIIICWMLIIINRLN